ncbi:hypothetical protein [Bradyrhizobium sp. AUGA SZCCT0160]|uniref:hypothetical protein n=1 Tax=Bradyrhizobium sp. AUGA SZCCT0160 TaxID=2807662 RepID=UPI001BA507B1|nr:hypothetical protein [Bradyrhizobium sp. AUGA SZCCT0160]MBR1193966.1 hypothetical protein [Bradyrhizobium sp. AUGA SZCCT0160]
MHATERRSEKLTLVLKPEQRRQIEAVRHQLEQRGRKASLSAVATALIEQALRQPAAV